MKEEKIIVGAELVPGKMMKLKLDSIVLVKPKIGITSMLGKNVDEIVDAIQPHNNPKAVYYIPLDEWRNTGYKVGSKISVEILPVEFPSPDEIKVGV